MDIDDLVIDEMLRFITVNKVTINLTPIEYNIFKLLHLRYPYSVPAAKLAKTVLRKSSKKQLNVHIFHLRAKLNKLDIFVEYLEYMKGYKLCFT